MGLTIIAFIGSVFSPWYAWARRGGAPADAENFCAVNVALYGAGKRRWAMTERPRAALERSASHLRIGPSSLEWDGRNLTIHVERTLRAAAASPAWHRHAAPGRSAGPRNPARRKAPSLVPHRAHRPGGGHIHRSWAGLVGPRLFRHQCRRRSVGGDFHRLGLVTRARGGGHVGAL